MLSWLSSLIGTEKSCGVGVVDEAALHLVDAFGAGRDDEGADREEEGREALGTPEFLQSTQWLPGTSLSDTTQ